MKLFGIDFGKFIVEQGIWEIIETLGEKSGLLSLEKNEKGEVMKRKFMGIGPEDEALNLLAWYQVFEKTGQLVKESGITGQDLLNLDRAMDHLDILERIKVKQVVGMQEKEVFSKVKEWFEPQASKEKAPKGKGGKSTKHVEKTTKMENVDGEKILHLFLSIHKIGGEKALHDFLRGTILVKPSDIAKKLVETANASIEEALVLMGKDPATELIEAQAGAVSAKARFLAKRAARLAQNP